MLESLNLHWVLKIRLLKTKRQSSRSRMKSKEMLHFWAVTTTFQIWIAGCVQHLNHQHLCSSGPLVAGGKAPTDFFMLWKEMVVSTGPFPLYSTWIENKHNYLLYYTGSGITLLKMSYTVNLFCKRRVAKLSQKILSAKSTFLLCTEPLWKLDGNYFTNY